MVGDRILATSDPARPGELLELPPDPRQPASKHRDMFAFQRRLHDLVGQPITLVVARDSEPEPIALTVPPAYNKSLGLRMRMGRVVAVRDKSPAVKADVRPRDPNNPDVKGDLIKTVEVQDGERIRRWVTTLSPTPPAGVDEQVLDPVKLPSELLAWSRQRPNDEVKLTVLRTEGHATDGKEVVLTLKWDDSWRYNEELPLDPASPASLPALGIAYAIESVIVDIAPDSPAAGKLNPREVITDILLYEIDRYGQEEPTRWLKLEGPDGTADRWAHVALWQLQDKESRRVKVRVSGRPDEIELTAAEDKSWPAVRRGFEFEPDVTYRKAAGVGEALWMALQKELSIAEQIYQSLKALVTGKVSPTQLHGPLSIAGTSYTIANYDLAEFVIFLGIISINLAIINFLPIPVLDGGHMVFLIYEMLTGRPPSEGVRIGATFGGLAFIVSLMLFVFGLDIARIFF
jgi:regulator of sigma E protease